MSKQRLKCNYCGRLKPKKTKLQTFTQPFPGKTVLGREVASEIELKVWLCACGRPNTKEIGLPLDPDAGLLRAYEDEFGAATPAVLDALANLKQQACLQLGEEMVDQDEFLLDFVRQIRANVGDGWADKVDFATTEFVRDEPATGG